MCKDNYAALVSQITPLKHFRMVHIWRFYSYSTVHGSLDGFHFAA